jgi:predicted transposase YbfD/YdcC
MLDELSAQITARFATLEDPRKGPALLHPLMDIVAIALCAVLCGADDWEEVALFGEAKYAWLKRFLALPHGIPSHDTFNRVFARLDPQQFESCFAAWVQAVADVIPGQVVAIDGKTLRRSHDQALGKGAIHMVSAWATTNRLVLGQVKVEDKSNEITAIPELLRWLDITGCTVTVDAMGCQKEIAAQIIAQGGDYVLALKGNQGHLEERVQILFAHAQTHDGREMEQGQAAQVDQEHGRQEKRHCQTLATQDWLFYLDPEGAWPQLRTVAKVTAERTLHGNTSVDTRYFISSHPCDAPLLLHSIRSHWGVENGLHWVLDVAFREDDSRLRKGHGAQNFSLLRRLALNLLRRDASVKAGIKAKRRNAGWDEAYLCHIILG